MNFQGVILGFVSFLCIGLFHPIVIKSEYHFGVKCWPVFLAVGVAGCIGSLFAGNVYVSVVLGVFSFSCFWSIYELFEQRKRVRKGWFPKNPRNHQHTGMIVTVAFLMIATSCNNRTEKITPEMDSSQFVLISEHIPDVILEIRYYGTYNFIGDRIPGYLEPVAILTRQAADSLKAVSEDLEKQGYRLKIFDAYRPQCAVDFFMKWAQDTTDERMKEYFYPELDKSVLVPQEYVAKKSSHTRGSTVDLTLFDMKLQKDVDMGCTFDYFGLASHPDVQPGQEIGAYKPIDEEQYRNRMILQKAMVSHGFNIYDCEWWHFTLKNEPFPDTYFNFPIATWSVNR